MKFCCWKGLLSEDLCYLRMCEPLCSVRPIFWFHDLWIIPIAVVKGLTGFYFIPLRSIALLVYVVIFFYFRLIWAGQDSVGFFGLVKHVHVIPEVSFNGALLYYYISGCFNEHFWWYATAGFGHTLSVHWEKSYARHNWHLTNLLLASVIN